MKIQADYRPFQDPSSARPGREEMLKGTGRTCLVFEFVGQFLYAAAYPDFAFKRSGDMADRKTDWRPGDVVVLVSGGPPMTVVGKDNSNRNTVTVGQFVCQWFDTSEKLCSGHFDPICLREVALPNNKISDMQKA